jgi:peptide/nickel transport system substrate-binding protein
MRPSLAERIDVEDVLVLEGGWGPGTENVYLGRVLGEEEGEVLWQPGSVPALSPEAREGAGETSLPSEEVERVERRAAFTFHLRDDVLWHDGHPFDARDVVFSIETYLNPHVQSEHARFRFERYHAFEALDDHTVRVLFEESFFLALESFEDDLTILPSHVYDLSDPDNPDHDPDGPGATPQEQGDYVNRHPANAQWIGLGPYRVVELTEQHIDAERFDAYFDEERGGFADSVRWRIVTDDAAARQALLAGEFDFFTRLRSRDYLGDFCAQPSFTERYEKGLYYTPQMNYVAWNLRRAPFDDVRVRRALGHAFDWDGFIETLASGMGRRVTASWYCFSPAYDQDLEGMPFDLERAEELLLEAGWYDRDGDGRIDKDGEPFEFELLYANVDVVARIVGQKLAENLEKLGIGVELVGRDFAARQELVRDREFDAAAMTWILPPELDPHGQWHSSQAGLPGSPNQPGYADPDSDRLIEAIHREGNPERRNELFHALQRRIHDAQPYLFGCVFPTKFAVSKRLRNVQRFYLDPGYSVRRWYVEPEPKQGEEGARKGTGR